MQKIALTIILFILTVTFLPSCSNNSNSSEQLKNNITLKASYNAETKRIEADLNNNTNDKIIKYTNQHIIYNTDTKENVTPEYADYGVMRDLMPNNNTRLSYSDDTALPKGKYKVVTTVYVYDKSELTTADDNGNEVSYLEYNSPHNEIELESEFII